MRQGVTRSWGEGALCGARAGYFEWAIMTPKEIIRVGPIEIRFLLDGEDTGGRVSMFEFVVPPGAKVPAPHYHELVDEVAYGLEGVLTFTVEGREVRLGPGDRCF